jgi:von Willebrand factor type A domain
MNPMKRLDEPEPNDFLPEASTAERLRRSPLTDPRALVCSLLIHGVILAIASVLAFRVVAPLQESAPGRTMQGELESTDNRALGDRGGSTGDPEGRAADLSAEPGIPAPPSKNPAADALLSEILPTRDSAEVTTETLPGPSTNGLGMLNATGSGEGGGPSGAVVGGGGKGTGPGTEFFGMKERGKSFAYVIDCSGSMFTHSSLEVAKRELLASLAQIAPDARFAIIFYNLDAKVFPDPSGQPGMMAATPANKARVRSFLATVQPDGFTDHVLALRTAFELHPEVIFFLTDAERMDREDATRLIALAGKTRIQAVQFGQISDLAGSAPLKTLAKATRGSFRYIDVNTFSP